MADFGVVEIIAAADMERGPEHAKESVSKELPARGRRRSRVNRRRRSRSSGDSLSSRDSSGSDRSESM